MNYTFTKLLWTQYAGQEPRMVYYLGYIAIPYSNYDINGRKNEVWDGKKNFIAR